MIKRSAPPSNAIVRFTYPPHPDGLPMYLRPDVWLGEYIQNGLPRHSFYYRILECTVGVDIGGIIKYIPSNLFDDFKETLVDLASIEREEDFVIVGSTPSPLRLQDILRVIQWLEEHPNPELAPPVED